MSNYQLEMEKIISVSAPGTPLVLHACCGPCSTTALERLCGHFDVSIYFYNPNIALYSEYALRLQTLESLLSKMPLPRKPKLACGEWNHDSFLSEVSGLENESEGGARCVECFRMRFKNTALHARRKKISLIGTTLSVSPHKNADSLNKIGMQAAKDYCLTWLPADLKKRGGYLNSIRLSERYELYRQSYCGCEFSGRTIDAN